MSQEVRPRFGVGVWWSPGSVLMPTTNTTHLSMTGGTILEDTAVVGGGGNTTPTTVIYSRLLLIGCG